MEVYAFMALMRLTLDEDRVVANLAQMALNLAKGIQDAEARAELAEASLEAERKKITGFMTAVEQCGLASGRAEDDIKSPASERGWAKVDAVRQTLFRTVAPPLTDAAV